MKKTLVLLVALALALCALAAQAEPLPHDQLQTVPEFTVHTIDGEGLALSGLLSEKDAVLLNVFATWCPPCQQEFPMIEALYEAYGERLAVVAVSAEPTDDDIVLARFRDYFGLTFPVANIAGSGIENFLSITAFPTTLLIGKDGSVLYSQMGAFSAYPQLTGVVERALSEGSDGSRFAFYGVYCYDQDENPVEGVTVGFCTDALCEPVTSDENGMILYFASPNAYHLQLLKLPEDYAAEEDFDETTDPEGGVWTLMPLERSDD